MPTQNKNFNSSFANMDPVINQLEILMRGLEQGGKFEDLFPAFQESLQDLRGDIKEDDYKVHLGQLVKNRGLDAAYMEQIFLFLSVRSDNSALASPIPKAGEETVRDYFLPNGGSGMDVSRCLFPEDKEREESADQSALKPRARSSWIRPCQFHYLSVRMLLLACWMI